MKMKVNARAPRVQAAEGTGHSAHAFLPPANVIHAELLLLRGSNVDTRQSSLASGTPLASDCATQVSKSEPQRLQDT